MTLLEFEQRIFEASKELKIKTGYDDSIYIEYVPDFGFLIKTNISNFMSCGADLDWPLKMLELFIDRIKK